MDHRILFLSSADPVSGPGRLALDAYRAMCAGGNEVDFLTLYAVPGEPDIVPVCGTGPGLHARVRQYFFTRMQKPAYYFFYRREICPPVRISRILARTKGPYDLIMVMFWQGMLSFQSVEQLHEHFHAPVVLFTVDCSVMTGGCHYPHDCRRYQQGCGRCPGLKLPLFDTFTRFNVTYRSRFYDKVDPFILCNTHVGRIFRESALLRGRKIVHCHPIVDAQQFRPRDKAPLRRQFDIPSHKRLVMLAGAQNFRDDRKGGRYLVEALNLFYERLSAVERDTVLVLTVGNSDLETDSRLRIDHRTMGYVDLDTLAALYAVSDLFLSPSVEDAGPMMVNQALSCGTPVVTFRLGTAVDVVEGKGTGFCAPLKDAAAFAEGIFRFWSMDDARREEMATLCRQVALETTSYEAFLKKLDTLF